MNRGSEKKNIIKDIYVDVNENCKYYQKGYVWQIADLSVFTWFGTDTNLLYFNCSSYLSY